MAHILAIANLIRNYANYTFTTEVTELYRPAIICNVNANTM